MTSSRCRPQLASAVIDPASPTSPSSPTSRSPPYYTMAEAEEMLGDHPEARPARASARATCASAS